MTYSFKKYEPSPIKRGHLNLGGSDPEGHEIAVNSLYLELDGRPWIGVMGEYHFMRDRRENWRRELAKMKAGGVNIISTYLLWLFHEEVEGEVDFTGDLDLRAFVETCGDLGLYVMIRVGPWNHAEARNGGFPDWLMERPFKLRDNNPQYMAEARRWYELVYREVAGLFFKDGGPIIGVQIENELVDNGPHIGALKELSREVGFDAPLFTVTGWNSMYGSRFPRAEFLPVFAAYSDEPWTQHTRDIPLCRQFTFDPMRNNTAMGLDVEDKTDETGWQLPYRDYPFALCELGAGLQSTHHRRVHVGGMDAYAMAMTKLGCGNNLVGYYMYHGGQNRLGRTCTFQESLATGGLNDYPILNYDFHTCLTQYGEAREQYGLLNLIHLFLSDFGEVLAPMEFVPGPEYVPAEDLRALRYCMRTDGHGGFVFVNHYQRGAALEPIKGAVIDTISVKFPAIDIVGDISFMFPFGLTVCGHTLDFATAQLICREGDTLFFASVPGIEARYSVDGRVYGGGVTIELPGLRIVTIPLEDAKFLRRLNGALYLGHDCNVYELEGKIECIEEGPYSYGVWDGREFSSVSVERQFEPAALTMRDVPEPFTPPYLEELNIGGPRSRTWKELQVSSPCGMVEISLEYDAIELYVDGVLAADKFYDHEPWRIPAALIYGRTAYIVMSEMRDDFHRDW